MASTGITRLSILLPHLVAVLAAQEAHLQVLLAVAAAVLDVTHTAAQALQAKATKAVTRCTPIHIRVALAVAVLVLLAAQAQALVLAALELPARLLE
jgi:hypothetical protein